MHFIGPKRKRKKNLIFFKENNQISVPYLIISLKKKSLNFVRHLALNLLFFLACMNWQHLSVTRLWCLSRQIKIGFHVYCFFSCLRGFRNSWMLKSVLLQGSSVPLTPLTKLYPGADGGLWPPYPRLFFNWKHISLLSTLQERSLVAYVALKCVEIGCCMV